MDLNIKTSRPSRLLSNVWITTQTKRLNLFWKKAHNAWCWWCAWPLISSLNLSPSACIGNAFSHVTQQRKLIQYHRPLVSSSIACVVSPLWTVLFLQKSNLIYVLFIYENCIDSYDIIWMDVYIFFKFSGKKLVNREDVAWFLVQPPLHQYLCCDVGGSWHRGGSKRSWYSCNEANALSIKPLVVFFFHEALFILFNIIKN